VLYYNQEREVERMDKEFWLVMIGLVMLMGLILTLLLMAGGII
jgi:hypothetical protein